MVKEGGTRGGRRGWVRGGSVRRGWLGEAGVGEGGRRGCRRGWVRGEWVRRGGLEMVG